MSKFGPSAPKTGQLRGRRACANDIRMPCHDSFTRVLVVDPVHTNSQLLYLLPHLCREFWQFRPTFSVIFKEYDVQPCNRRVRSGYDVCLDCEQKTN
eukprot:m.133992 g.133992  ORF g.133992 m.133992 type:complete len:97 (-) comp13851_c0_seq2:4001-4291(-)